ncbi:MAG: elongation factor P [Planctomycetes bacterium]|nr:elongation factor P [Planctomycetota bacterium]
MYSANELKKGVVIELDGAPQIVETTHVSSPVGRGGNTIHRIRLRNLKTGQRSDKSFRSGEMFTPANVERRPIQFLYDEPEVTHFMDSETFEQFALAHGDIEWERQFLVDGLEDLRAMYYNGLPMALELPNSVVLTITETAPGVRGNSANSRSKPATLQTGYVIQVPEHIEQGTSVNVDTRTGEFLGRAKS